MSGELVGVKDTGRVHNALHWETRINGDPGPCNACVNLGEGIACVVVPYIREYFFETEYGRDRIPQHKECGEWHIRRKFHK